MHCHETSLETLGPVQAGHACSCRFRVAFRDGKRVDINERTSASSICGVVENCAKKNGGALIARALGPREPTLYLLEHLVESALVQRAVL